MSKRFIDFSSYAQAWRKLEPRLRSAMYWIWEFGCDEAGVWRVDLDLFKFENGYALDVEALLKSGGGAVVRLDADRLIFPSFIAVNYTSIKDGYNPHKPVLRALLSNNLKLDASLTKAYLSLEDEDEEEDNSGKEQARAEMAEAELEPTFEQWWTLYAKSRDKASCQAKWRTLPHETHVAIMEHTRAYLVAQPDKLYRKDPIRYLTKQSWTDEIVAPKTNNGQSQEDKQAELDRIAFERYGPPRNL